MTVPCIKIKSVSMALIHTYAFLNGCIYAVRLRADSEADCEYPPDCEFYKTVSARSTISGIVATASIVDRANISEE